MLRKVAPDQIKKGMYIHAFEGGWFSHPFWRSGFVLETDSDLGKIHACTVDAVIIDDERGLGPEEPQIRSPEAKAVAVARPRSCAAAASRPILPLRAPGRSIPPAVAGPSVERIAQDRRQATRVVDTSKRVMREAFDGIRLGKAIRAADVASVVDDISASLDRNRSMLIGITRLKSKHEYTYLHSVAVCALMVNLAREIGLEEDTVRMLGLAGLLHDVGKMTVDDAILDKPGKLTDDEFAEIRHHASRGHALLTEGEDVPDEALDVCLHHHEKIDGSGYPYGLKDDQISLAARMGAICDVYDAITSARAYKEPWLPIDAITAMDGWKGHFDEKLLFSFMKSVDIYPVGTLVRLRSNQLAIVACNGRRASRTRTVVFYAITARDFIQPYEAVMSDTLAGDKVMSREDPAAWCFHDWDAIRNGLLGAKPKQRATG